MYGIQMVHVKLERAGTRSLSSMQALAVGIMLGAAAVCFFKVHVVGIVVV